MKLGTIRPAGKARAQAVAWMLGVLAASALLFPYLGSSMPTADAQIPPKVMDGTPVSAALTAISTDTAMFVKYVGTATSATVDVNAATGDLTFQVSAAAADTLECPVSGALGGIIDVSDAACDTLGEVVDAINDSCRVNASNCWRAALVDGMRSDSSNNTLDTLSAAQAGVADGLALKFDTAVLFKLSQALIPASSRTIKTFLGTGTVTTGTPTGGTAVGRGAALIPNPYTGTQTVLFIANATTTYASGTSNFEVWAVRPSVSPGASQKGSETTQLLYSTAGGATTANKVFDFSQFGLYGLQDAKLLVRVNNSAALSAPLLYAYGIDFKYAVPFTR